MIPQMALLSRRICGVVMIMAYSIICSAQLPDGTTAPDFTLTDTHGVVQNLYTYLNQGKYVAIDISATWCVPCWGYHNTHVLDSLYSLHDAPGDNTWKVLFIEGDGSTDSADLHGTGTNTQGDWVGSSQYTFIDPPNDTALTNFMNGYNIVFFPMLYIICPDGKIIHDTLNTLRPGLAGWEATANNMCRTTQTAQLNKIPTWNIYPNPSSGSVMLQLQLDKGMDMSLTVVNYIGQTVIKEELGYLYAGSHSIEYNTAHLIPGTYIFKLSGINCNGMVKRVIIQ